MKKRIIAFIVFLLTACLMFSACISEETEPAVAAEKPAEGPVYTYDVEGATIPLHTRVEDYITDDRVFRYFDLAKEHGWHSYWPEYEGNYEYTLLVYNNAFIRYYMGADKITGEILYGKMSEKYPGLEGSYKSIRIDEDAFDDDNEYFVNEKNGYRMRFSQMVLITYLVENNKPEPNKNLLDEFFPMDDNHYVLSN